MKWKDIDFHNALCRIPETKNGEQFVASLRCQVMEILNDLSENNNDDLVFQQVIPVKVGISMS